MFASDYNASAQKFGYWAYADKMDKDIKSAIKGKHIKIKFSSYPFYFNDSLKEYESYINVGIETTSGAIAKKIMERIYTFYSVNEGAAKSDITIECLHNFDTLSIEGFDIDTDTCTIDNIFIGS